MITKDIDVNGEKFRVMLTEQVINHVNNLKSLYDAAYEDPESFEQVSAEISSAIQEISKSVEPKPGDMHLDNLIQQIIKTVNDKNEETNKQSQDKSVTRKTKKRTKKIKSKK
ncbi:MAG: hypothetical protein CMO18_03055 [Thaumarchaeota archaeon]|jgi:hypothetical protein|nr:hypothetical protein [Nitrososphaerota archaeon]|tara:strand:- start:825 stop:1160 length:336 start_codon:yes stop_codon:yes gene_type:complete